MFASICQIFEQFYFGRKISVCFNFSTTTAATNMKEIAILVIFVSISNVAKSQGTMRG